MKKNFNAIKKKWLLMICLVSVLAIAGMANAAKSTFLVPVSPYGSGWEELAYLAAVPASATVNTDEPSVIALGGFGIRPDEVDWYLDRYDPANIYQINLQAQWSQGHWLLDEGSGSVAYDLSDNGSDGTITGAAWSSGVLTFDGSGDYVTATGYKGITGTSDRTVGAWVKTSTDGVVLSWGHTSNNGQSWVLKIQDGHVCVDVGNAYKEGSTNVADNTWHHIAARLSSTGSPSIAHISLFVDGVKETVVETYDVAGSALAGGLLGYWKMNDGTGNTAQDSSLWDKDGTLMTNDAEEVQDEGPDWDNGGKLGGCLYFNADYQNWVEVPDDSHFGVYDAFSVSLWVKQDVDSTSGNKGIICKGTGFEQGWHLDQYATSERVQVKAMEESGSSVYGLLGSVGSLSDDQWEHLVYVFDYTTSGTMKLYVNGSLDQSISVDESVKPTARPLRWGSKSWGDIATGFFQGYIDEVAVWDRAVSSTEVSSLYNSGDGQEIDLGCTGINTSSAEDVKIGIFNSAGDFSGTIKNVMIFGEAMTDDEIVEMYAMDGQSYTGISIISQSSLDGTACYLAQTFWTNTTSRVVLCDQNDYAAALAASALAGRLEVPLLFFDGSSGLSSAALDVIEDDLQCSTALTVSGNSTVTSQLSGISVSQTSLADADEILDWMVDNDLPVDYFAVCNPNDRTAGKVLKSSITAPLMAASRGGAVIPLDYDTVWKKYFNRTSSTFTQPSGAPSSLSGDWLLGTLTLGAYSYDYVLAAGYTANYYDIAKIDFNDDGDFADAGEGPFESSATVTVGGKDYSITVGQYTTGDVKFTYPTIGEVKTDLTSYYTTLGQDYPEYMCIVGYFDTIPPAIEDNSDRYRDVEDLPNDHVIGDVDADAFQDISVGRIVGNSLLATTLLGTRSVTYDDLVGNPNDWANKAKILTTEGGDNGGFCRYRHFAENKLENVGFTVSEYILGQITEEQIPDDWMVNVGAIVQENDASAYGIGYYIASGPDDLKYPTAPYIVEATGCVSAGIDVNPLEICGSLNALKKGAAAWFGTTRGTPLQKNAARYEIWNQLCDKDQTFGIAFKNALHMLRLWNLEGDNGMSVYARRSMMFYGDPALNPYTPSTPSITPAYLAVNGSTLTATAPETWWYDTQGTTPETYVWHGAGLTTSPDGYFQKSQLLARYTTNGTISNLTQEAGIPSALGWPTSEAFIDENRDGSETAKWRCCPIDYDVSSGSINYLDEDINYTVTVSSGGTVSPTVLNSQPTNLTETSARLNGLLLYTGTQTGDSDPTVTIYWGDNDGGTTTGNWDNSETIGTKRASEMFSADISGLSKARTYYFRCRATNSAGSDWADATTQFVTPGIPEPTVITTAAQLQAIANDVTGYYVLGNNITLTGSFTSIADFSGTFDGAMHTIDGLSTSGGTRANGLFGKTLAGSVVKNVGLTNVNITPTAGAWYPAALIGDCYGTVEKCWVDSGSVTVNGGGNVGTLVGIVRSGGSVTDCYSLASLTVTNSPSYVAGFTKGDYGMTNCYFAGSITGSVADGFNVGGTPTHCYYDMTVAGFDDDSGLERTTAQMKTQSNFVNWDFDDTWIMIEDETYPKLITVADPMGILSSDALVGNNPTTGQRWAVGDTYRLIFVTSEGTTATSSNIATYNTFVQGLADDAGLGSVTWNVVGSTATVDARDNTSTNPNTDGTGEAVYLMDGTTVIADNYDDLWDGMTAIFESPYYYTIKYDENGDVNRLPTDGRVFTGTGVDGKVAVVSSIARPLGGSTESPAKTQSGKCWSTTSMNPPHWVAIFSDNATGTRPVYAISEPITLVSQ